MKTLVLSDHTSDQAALARSRRETEFASALDGYTNALASRESGKQRARDHLADVWKSRRAWQTLIAAARYARAALAGKPSRPTMRVAGNQETVWLTGNEGEQKVAALLARMLEDDWTLVCGYRNAGGEIDQVVVGPPGVFAIEVKHLNGTVHCDGDRWWRDKSDKYGNVVERNVAIGDKNGRSPSRQVNEAADQLQSLLTRRLPSIRVSRAVILSHASSRMGQCRNVTIDCIATLKDWKATAFLRGHGSALAGSDRELVLESIRQDHGARNRPRRATVR